jgi:myo-inositol-1(or 4)-monophosphatase
MNEEPIILLQAVKAAGDAILQLHKTGFSVARKANNDLLTQADVLANEILKEHLLKSFPTYGWLSEESVDDLERLQHSRVWIVDPIDGTKEYAMGIPEYAVSVALAENGIPILACVFNPATNEMFHAIKSQGVWLNNKSIRCDESLPQQLIILASRTEYKRGEWARYKDHRVQPMGSIAYKLALIAAGRAHATFSLGPKNEWDIAAGVLLVTEAGGRATDQLQHLFIFNQADVLVDGIVASTIKANATVFEMLGAR